MPTGKVKNPDGPGAQGTLGTVECSDGNIYPFFNTGNLKKDEPLVFEIEKYDLNIYGNHTVVPVAVLECDKSKSPMISERPWDTCFKTKWDEEWGIVSESKISALAIKLKGKKMDKKRLLRLQEL